MTDRPTDEETEDFYRGLRALAASAFPKRCPSCGRCYETPEAFIRETERLQNRYSGLKQSLDDDDRVVVELFRNCVCGSTLMDLFTDRRDSSDTGAQRRKRFAELLSYLKEQGIDPATARRELLKILRGGHSDVIARLKPPK